MKTSSRLTKSGLELSQGAYEPWHGNLCSCSKCYAAQMDSPFYIYGYNFRSEILTEAKTRKCVRKRCKREGCNCQ